MRTTEIRCPNIEPTRDVVALFAWSFGSFAFVVIVMICIGWQS